ncbi:MAG: 4'-phosphopantetheinyl transferase superfamily protein [Acidimicrobiales bacterium]|nr:4'-phosphopantetheinyl transferase superfamily protein [Acidimicrobiales bacterium]
MGIGVDLVCVSRFRRALERRPSLSERLFSAEERAYAAGFADPAPRLAARLAAKEAAVKALGVSLFAVRFSDVRVGRRPSGAPTLEVAGRALEVAHQLGVEEFLVSLTHTRETAEAVVLALGGPLG